MSTGRNGWELMRIQSTRRNTKQTRRDTKQNAKSRGVRGDERWGAGVETQKNVPGEIGGWGRVPFNETYAPSLSTIYNGA